MRGAAFPSDTVELLRLGGLVFDAAFANLLNEKDTYVEQDRD